MKKIECKLSESDWKKLETIKKNMMLRSDRDFLRLIIDEKYIPHEGWALTSYFTAQSRFGFWMENSRKNLEDIIKSPDIQVMGREEIKRGGGALVIGSGPSVFKDDFRQLKMLAESDYKGTILAADRAVRNALEHGIVPDYALCLDAKGVVATWFDCDIIREHMHEIKLILPIHVDPKIPKMWKGEKYFCIPYISEKQFPNIIHTLKLLLGKTTLESGGCSGLFGWFIARGMKKNPIAMIGLDMSYPDGVDITKTQKYIDLASMFGAKFRFEGGEERDISNLPDEGQHCHFDEEGNVDYVEFPSLGKITDITYPSEKAKLEVERSYLRERNHYWKNYYITDSMFKSLVSAFTINLRVDKRLNPKVAPTTINCSERGALWRKPIVQMRFKSFLEKYHA